MSNPASTHVDRIGTRCAADADTHRARSHFAKAAVTTVIQPQSAKKRNKHANWNYSGYYAEQRPGQPALVYDGPARMPPQFPPVQHAAQPPPFPTPHQLNAKPTPPPAAQPTTQPRNYTAVSRSQVNVAVQHQEINGAAAKQQ